MLILELKNVGLDQLSENVVLIHKVLLQNRNKCVVIAIFVKTLNEEHEMSVIFVRNLFAWTISQKQWLVLNA